MWSCVLKLVLNETQPTLLVPSWSKVTQPEQNTTGSDNIQAATSNFVPGDTEEDLIPNGSRRTT
jgi:hypothetical protein